MKHAITIRLDPELLETARIKAKEENRTLTNFVETALKERFDASRLGTSSRSSHSQKNSRQRNLRKSTDAK